MTVARGGSIVARMHALLIALLLTQAPTDAPRAAAAEHLAGLARSAPGSLDTTPNTVVLVDATHAVARTSARRPDGSTFDVYVYLTLDGAWRATATRALALPKFFYDLRDSLRATPSPTAEQRAELANVELIFKSDAELRAWFAENRDALERLAGLAARAADHEKARALAATLHLSSVSTEGAAVRLLVGGIMDNSVGFLYSPKAPPPEITTNEYIWVEEIAPGWYLYRTT
jgi:hypothetical protein